MSRLILIVILAWTLLLLPALCTGGWLLHPCDCGSTIGCEHEADCDSDPCQIEMARADSWAQGYADMDSHTARTSIAIDCSSTWPQLRHANQSPNATSLAFQKALPFPPPDLPLLI